MDDKKKTLLVTADYPWMAGGQARYLGALFSSDLGVVVAPETPGDGSRFPAERVAVPLGSGALEKLVKIVMLTLRTLSLCRTRPTKALCAGQATAGAAAVWIAARLFRKPYALVIHGGDLLSWRWARGILKRMLSGASVVICNSRYTEKMLEEFVHVAKSAVVHPPQALDFTRAKRDRAGFGLKDDAIVLLTVARLIPRKGIEQVIDAAAPLMKREPRLVYVIAGSGTERARLEARAKEVGIADRVKFLGFVADDRLAPLYLSADIFILTAFSDKRDAEGFGIVYVEAQAAGLPVIVSGEGGAPETVDGGKTAILVSPSNIDEIREAVRRLSEDSALRRYMGDQGKAWVGTRFNAETQKRKFWELLEAIDA